MAQLTEIQTIRFSQDQINLMDKLKSVGISPDRFIRQAFIEKIEQDLPKLIAQHNEMKDKEYCPF